MFINQQLKPKSTPLAVIEVSKRFYRNNILQVLSFGRFMFFKELENYPIVTCREGEGIICVQRKHPVILIGHLLLLSFAILTIPFSFSLIFFTYPDLLNMVVVGQVLIAYGVLTLTAIFLTVAIYLFLSWYYHFYVITNKALVDRYSFRLGGPYSEVIFGEKMHVQEIIRKPRNIFYDFLKIYDVYVYFHQLEREEPFIFRSPKNSQQIEDVIEGLSAKEKD